MRAFIVTLLLLTLVVSFRTTWFETAARSLQLRRIDQAWTSINLVDVTVSDNLQDGIPDGWEVQAWGGANRIYRLDEQNGFAGRQSTVIERTGDQGVAALVQRITVSSGSQLVGSVYAKGAAGAIQFRFRTKELDNWTAKGWLEIEPSNEWQQYHLSVLVPTDAIEAELRLRTTGLAWFDETYVGMDQDGHLGPNLLRNPGFEQDGISENPLDWWEAHVVNAGAFNLSRNTVPDRLSILNIADMLNGEYQSIQQRARQKGDSCVHSPDMTSWLLAWGPEFEERGGLAARERLYQLAMQLAPNCPQPYAALARLYESHSAYSAAANSYHQAALLSGETAEAGRYYFEQGLLHLRHTGDISQAISALRLAVELSGWESGTWYQGAASFYLGQALETKGRLLDAANAFQRVIDCKECAYYHLPASARLQALSGKK